MAETVPLVRDHAAEFHGVAAWPAQPKLVPTVIVCESAPPYFDELLTPPRLLCSKCTEINGWQWNFIEANAEGSF